MQLIHERIQLHNRVNNMSMLIWICDHTKTDIEIQKLVKVVWIVQSMPLKAPEIQ